MGRRSWSTKLAPAGFVVEHAEIDTVCVFLDVRATALSATCPACRRDVHQRSRPVDVSLSRHRQCRRPSRIWFSEQHDLSSAKGFFRKALARYGRPDRVVIDDRPTRRLSSPVTHKSLVGSFPASAEADQDPHE